MFGKRRASRVTAENDVAAAIAQPTMQQLHLRAFSATVAAVDTDKHTQPSKKVACFDFERSFPGPPIFICDLIVGVNGFSRQPRGFPECVSQNPATGTRSFRPNVSSPRTSPSLHLSKSNAIAEMVVLRHVSNHQGLPNSIVCMSRHFSHCAYWDSVRKTRTSRGYMNRRAT